MTLSHQQTESIQHALSWPALQLPNLMRRTSSGTSLEELPSCPQQEPESQTITAKKSKAVDELL